MTIEDVLSRHRKIGLQFSGGRDSLAVLYLMRPHWDLMTVYYTDSGDTYPETKQLVQRVASEVPKFEIISGRQPQFTETAGWPSDVVPADNTPFAINLASQRGQRIVDKYACCYQSIMIPMHQRMKLDGVTLVIRGQKNLDRAKGVLRSGATADGIEFLYPIEDWTDEDVMEYLKDEGVPIPPFYEAGLTSTPDCLHCTAWLEHGALPYLRLNHPAVARTVDSRLEIIKAALVEPLKRMGL